MKTGYIPTIEDELFSKVERKLSGCKSYQEKLDVWFKYLVIEHNRTRPSSIESEGKIKKIRVPVFEIEIKPCVKNTKGKEINIYPKDTLELYQFNRQQVIYRTKQKSIFLKNHFEKRFSNTPQKLQFIKHEIEKTKLQLMSKTDDDFQKIVISTYHDKVNGRDPDYFYHPYPCFDDEDSFFRLNAIAEGLAYAYYVPFLEKALEQKNKPEQANDEPKALEIKPTFKAEVLEEIFNILKPYFNPEQHRELKRILEMGDRADKKLLFKENGNKLVDCFAKCYNNQIAIGCQKVDIEKWVSENFEYIFRGKVKKFKLNYLHKIISGNSTPCKSPIIKIEQEGDIFKMFPVQRNKKKIEKK